jgi:ABC-type transporter Mla MlaB component
MGADDPQPVMFAIAGPIARSDLSGLCRRICGLLDVYRAETVFCDASDVPADAVTVDALARLQLAAHRYGCQIRLQGASAELLELLAFMGLANVLPQ